jgi:O-methyltransferase
MTLLTKLIRAVVPPEVQAPPDLIKRILVRSGYFKLRTKLAAHGQPIPDRELYQPLFSPWEGQSDFESLYQQIHPYTLCSRDRAYILWATLRQALLLKGDVFECGVFRGGTALLEASTMARCEKTLQGKQLHLFDSFSGMPPTTAGVDRLKTGDLSTTSESGVAALLEHFAFVHIHAGFIPETFVGLQAERICWAHVDVDIYQSVRDCISYIYPRLAEGGFLIFDDYGFPSCPGARRAVDEAFLDLPEVPICLPTGQCLIVKQSPSEDPDTAFPKTPEDQATGG